MNAGRIEQEGPPDRRYADPDPVLVASVLGAPRMNLLPRRVVGPDGGRALVDAEALGVTPMPGPLPRDVVLGIRPEALSVDGPEPRAHFWAEVVENMGAAHYLYAGTECASASLAEVPRGHSMAVGETVERAVPPDACLPFAREGGRL